MIELKLQSLKLPLKHRRTCSTSHSGLSMLLKTLLQISQWKFSIRLSRWQKNSMQGQGSMLMSEALAELQNLNEIIR